MKSLLGVDIGHDRLKLTLAADGKVKATAVAQMPEKVIKNGRIVSIETVAELIRDTMKKNGIRCRNAVILLSEEFVFVKNISMPVMTESQLCYNLPFEFKDYLTEEAKNYVFDYAMYTDLQQLKELAHISQSSADESSKGRSSFTERPSMELLGVAAPADAIEEARMMLRKAGLRMVGALPATAALSQLLAKKTTLHPEDPEEYCILDLGFKSIRMYMFLGTRHVVTKSLEYGLSGLIEVISEQFGVDIHLAQTYLLNNFEQCQYSETAKEAYGRLSVELMRAVNFYRFSNPDSRLSKLWIAGGGSAISPLIESIRSTLDMDIHEAAEFIPGSEDQKDLNALLFAAAAAIA